MESPRVRRPIGVTAIAGLLLVMGVVIFSTVLFVMVSDMEYLTSAAGLKMQAVWLLFAGVGFLVSSFGFALWHGWSWSWNASLLTLVAFTGWCAYSIISVGTGSLGMRDLATFALFASSALYLLAPSVRVFFHAVEVPEPKQEVSFARSKVLHGAV